MQSTTDESLDNLHLLGELLAKGTLTAVIDRYYLLVDVADAHRYVETGRKTGNVVIHHVEKSG